MEKIERIRDNEVLIDGIKYIKDEHEPEFKVPEWVKWRYRGETKIFYVVSKIGDYGFEVENGSHCEINNCCPATPDEIESHLRKICDEKYIGKKVKCLHCGEYTIINTPHPSGYDKKYDQFWMIASNSDGVCVYEQGKFASIIPDKKKLPKTREEFKVFLNDYDYERAICDDEFTINIYLNEYEIQ